jgi:predicted metalloprotease
VPAHIILSSRRRTHVVAVILAAVFAIALPLTSAHAAGASATGLGSSTGGELASPSQAHRLRLPRQPRTMADFMVMTLKNVHAYWGKQFAGTGLPAPSVHYRFFTKRQVKAPRACGGRAAQDDPFYCDANDTIYFGARFARRIWTGSKEFSGVTRGDMGVAVVLAHEYGHNVQDELGQPYVFHGKVKGSELEADCFAGLWANDAYYQTILDADDLTDATETLGAVGDDSPDPYRHHGTRAERQSAFMTGYDTGAVAACDAIYQTS